MNDLEFNPIKKSDRSHRVERPTQTGFSSPATHYSEPRIDLNEVLVKNPSSTFYIRVVDHTFADYGILENDVLIVDKSLTPRKNQLALIIREGSFEIERMGDEGFPEISIWGVITYIIKSGS